MSDNSKHAILSPSGAHRWMRCPGSVAASAGLKSEDTEYSKEGTAAHELAAICLTQGGAAKGYVGRKMSNGYAVTDDMALDVQDYVDYVLAMVEGLGGVLLVEEALDISFITSEEDAKGTADAIILTEGLMVVIDLKFGRGVAVEAEDNEQLLMYAAAAHNEYSSNTDTYEEVLTIIYQPRLSHISEASYSVDDVRVFIAEAKGIAKHISAGSTHRKPGEKQCRWCLAKASCEELKAFVEEETQIDFEDLTIVTDTVDQSLATLGKHRQAVDLVEMWCDAIKDAVNKSLHAGKKVPGYKLVQGKEGNRVWADATEAEEAMAKMRLKKIMYKQDLISPTVAEKLAKAGDIGARQWGKLQDLIVRPKGKLKVVPESDKGTEVIPDKEEDMFSDVSLD